MSLSFERIENTLNYCKLTRTRQAMRYTKNPDFVNKVQNWISSNLPNDLLKELKHEILTLIFFIPIDRPDLGDGPLGGINFGRWTFAEKRAFYTLTRMLIFGTKLLSPWV